MAYTKEILCLAVEIGNSMLKNGIYALIYHIGVFLSDLLHSV